MRWIPYIIFLIVVEWYAFQALKTLTQNKVWWTFYGVTVSLILGNIIWQTLIFDRSVGWTPWIAYGVGSFIALLSGQLVMILVLFFEDLSRIALSVYHFFATEQK